MAKNKKSLGPGGLKRRTGYRGQRNVDNLVRDVDSWLGKTLVFIKKTRVRTWKGVFVLAFAAGVTVAIIWAVLMNIQTSSKAAGSARLELYTDDTAVTLEEGSNRVNMDIFLNTDGEDVVIAKAVVNYNPLDFELESWSTDNSVFVADNGCVYEGNPCRIVSEDPDNGTISITIAKPSPGVKTNSGIVGQLVFKALRETAPNSSAITLSYVSGSYDDSDVIIDDGNGTDILAGVTNASVTVYATTVPPPNPVCVYHYSDWSACVDGKQTRVETKSPEGCVDDDEQRESVERGCVLGECIYEYSSWAPETCPSSGKQTRMESLSPLSPPDCAQGKHEMLERDCAYAPPPETIDNPGDGDNDDDDDDDKPKDKEDPKFTDLPYFLSKNRGDMVWWKAKDNKGIEYYTYNFNGKKVKTTRKHFLIPVDTPPGIYLLRVKAYDKAGNDKSRLVTLRVK